MATRDFKMMDLLGKGSFGSVYKAKRRSDGHTYAVKEISITSLNRRERMDALNEIRILASIKHRNIVRYCEAFVEKDKLYIVMEYAERGDIYRQIKKHKNAHKLMKEELVWMYLIQICEGLQELHSKKVLHRDLKPKNIFLTGENHIRIGDLGCAKLMPREGGLAKTQIGTPYYMSPEIWSKRPYDHKSDMWALGCVIFEMCALQPPFLASDMPSLAHKVKTSRLPRIPSCYSSDLSNLVSSLLSKSAHSRPSVEQLLAMACVHSRRRLVPGGDNGGRWADDDAQSRLLKTIKVPRNLGKRRVDIDLPSPCYPERARPRTSPAKVQRPAAASAASSSSRAPAGGAGAATTPTRGRHGGRPATSPVRRPRTPTRATTDDSSRALLKSRQKGTRTPDKLRLPSMPEGRPLPKGRVIVTARDRPGKENTAARAPARGASKPPTHAVAGLSKAEILAAAGVGARPGRRVASRANRASGASRPSAAARPSTPPRRGTRATNAHHRPTRLW